MSAVADRLTGAALPRLALPSTEGGMVTLSDQAGVTVVYIYPRTAPPDGASISGWGEVTGARGCTPQSCGFRDHFEELRAAGAAAVFGLSVQDSAYQREAQERLALPFPLLSDADGALRRALDLPTCTLAGQTFLERMALVTRDGRIVKVFHPVTDPGANAAAVLAWLTAEAARA